MDFSLNNAEINAALTSYIANQGIAVEGKDVNIQLTAGRKNSKNGNSAAISITEKGAKVAPATTEVPAGQGNAEPGENQSVFNS